MFLVIKLYMSRFTFAIYVGATIFGLIRSFRNLSRYRRHRGNRTCSHVLTEQPEILLSSLSGAIKVGKKVAQTGMYADPSKRRMHRLFNHLNLHIA